MNNLSLANNAPDVSTDFPTDEEQPLRPDISLSNLELTPTKYGDKFKYYYLAVGVALLILFFLDTELSRYAQQSESLTFVTLLSLALTGLFGDLIFQTRPFQRLTFVFTHVASIYFTVLVPEIFFNPLAWSINFLVIGYVSLAYERETEAASNSILAARFIAGIFLGILFYVVPHFTIGLLLLCFFRVSFGNQVAALISYGSGLLLALVVGYFIVGGTSNFQIPWAEIHDRFLESNEVRQRDRSDFEFIARKSLRDFYSDSDISDGRERRVAAEVKRYWFEHPVSSLVILFRSYFQIWDGKAFESDSQDTKRLMSMELFFSYCTASRKCRTFFGFDRSTFNAAI